MKSTRQGNKLIIKPYNQHIKTILTEKLVRIDTAENNASNTKLIPINAMLFFVINIYQKSPNNAFQPDRRERQIFNKNSLAASG